MLLYDKTVKRADILGYLYNSDSDSASYNKNFAFTSILPQKNKIK